MKMHRIRPIGVLGFCVFTVGFSLWAADAFWKKPFTSWTREQVQQMLSESPWAKSFVLATDTGKAPLPSQGVPSTGGSLRPPQAQNPVAGRSIAVDEAEGRSPGSIAGEREIFDAYRIRLFSALPIRQAHVRKIQLDSGYDQMNAGQREGFDQRTSRALSLDVRDRIIVSLEFESNDRLRQLEVYRNLREKTASQLKQSAYLITEGFERLELQEYYPPSPDGSGAKFIYPRTIRDEPVVAPEDRELKFEFSVPGTSDKLYIVWNVDELRFRDRLAY